jgi:hypothetical protein
MGIFIEKGWLIQDTEITIEGDPVVDKSGEPYGTFLAFQVYDENGDPVTGNYKGPGSVNGTQVILGDPYRTTNLIEYKCDRQATSESWDHYQGYREALTTPRQLSAKQYAKKIYGQTRAWEDGYQQGYAERKMRGARRVRS